MTLIDTEFDSFIKTVLRALSDYVEDVVFIGGCTNALYRFVSSAGNQSLPILLTKDFDAAVEGAIAQRDRMPLSDLIKQAGLKANLHPTYEPPIMKFHPTKNENFELEFLCPLKGADVDRNGKQRVTKRV